MTARETAQLLQVSEATIYRFARSGDLPCLRFGRKVLFARHAIERVLERGTLDR
ncbi:MAG: helix-turn-helix domain-containing protein [Chloroflexi bacterium]|nr:helix-turn-helix domain-containing protein [Chloroflexota bacterium]